VNSDIIVPVAFFSTVVVLSVGIPLVRAYIRRQDSAALRPPTDGEAIMRLARIETAIESMAVEIERISEGQRFTTKLLSERQALGSSSLSAGDVKGGVEGGVPGAAMREVR
jgi:hypothetical protein